MRDRAGMKLVPRPGGPVPLATTPLHLGPGSTASAVDGFSWDPEVLAAYGAATGADGADGRLVMVFDSDASWTSWERHPAGDEVVVCLSGRLTMVRDDDEVALGPGDAVVTRRAPGTPPTSTNRPGS